MVQTLLTLILSTFGLPSTAEKPPANQVAVVLPATKTSVPTSRTTPATNPWKSAPETLRVDGDLAQPQIIPPVPLSLETMLGQLEVLRTQKAVIEEQEATLLKAIRENAGRQLDRMKKLGIDVPASNPSKVAKKSRKTIS